MQLTAFQPLDDTLRRGLTIGFPSLAVWVFGFIPLVLVFIVSLSHNVQGGSWEWGFEADNYLRLFELTYLKILAFSIYVSALVAVIAVLIGFPFTYYITRLSRKAQIGWLIFLLAGLSLSEVLIAFAWQVLLSRNIGISPALVAIGILDRPVSLQPGFGALLAALTHLVLPYTFLLFYPPLSRLSPDLTEAARTMGASPFRTFISVVVPASRMPIIGSLILVFVYILGAYVTPSQLGRPQHWTMSVHITDQATQAFNLPFASALAITLMIASIIMVVWSTRLGREKGGA